MIMKLWGRSFRFRQQNLCETPSNEGLTMTSYPVCSKTSLSRKPCITAVKLLWNAIRESQSLFQNPSLKSGYSAPWNSLHNDVTAVTTLSTFRSHLKTYLFKRSFSV